MCVYESLYSTYLIGRFVFNMCVCMYVHAYNLYWINALLQLQYAPPPLSVSSQPLNLMSVEVTVSTISLQWDPPSSPNGVIAHYVVTYNGMAVNTTNASTMLTLIELEPFTTYTISVAGSNGAGVGNASDNVAVRTSEGG